MIKKYIEGYMNKTDLNKIAKNLCASPKGILAADESTNTIKKI